MPDFYLMFTDTVLVFDNVRQTLKIIANVPIEEFASARKSPTAAPRRKSTRLSRGCKRRRRRPVSRAAAMDGNGEPQITSNQTREGYMGMVDAAKEYIAAGDIIQVVPSQRFEAPLTAHPFNLYRSLRTINPSPYMFYVRLGRHDAGGRVAGDDGAGGRPRDHAASDRGNAAARRQRGGRSSRSNANCWRIPRRSPST